MSLSNSKCWYSNKCLHFLKRVVQFIVILKITGWCQQSLLQLGLSSKSMDLVRKKSAIEAVAQKAFPRNRKKQE